jgi:hypothetical protein
LADVFMDTNAFAESATITRGGDSTSGVSLIFDMWASSIAKNGDDPGVTTAATTPVIYLPITSYVINSAQVEPRRGDTITRANGDVYEVQPIDGKRCWEPVEDGQTMQVFVKKVG